MGMLATVMQGLGRSPELGLTALTIG